MKYLFLPFSLAIATFCACHKCDPEETSQPDAFQTFAGKYLVQDTAVQRALVWDSQFSNHLEVLAPVSNGTKEITLEFLPEEQIKVYDQDTVLVMNLSIQAGNSYKVNIHPDGVFTWNDGNQYTPNDLNGTVVGDTLQFSVIRFNNNTGEYSGNRYLGKKE